MRSKRNLVRFLVILVVFAFLIAIPVVANVPPNVALWRTSFVTEPSRSALRIGMYVCPLCRKAQCNLYAFNANDSNEALCMATA